MTTEMITAELDQPETNRSRGSIPFTYILFTATAVAMVMAMLSGALGRQVVGALGILLVVNLILLGLPVAIAIILGGVIGIGALAGFQSVPVLLGDAPFVAASSWSLSVLPMFIFMGLVMWRSGISGRIFETARAWVGGMPGGLAVATNLAGAGLAASSGSSLGISYALGRVAIPEMLRAGYRASLASAVVVVAGTLGQLIPPSIILVVYAGVAGTPVGPQLIAAVIPGVVLALMYSVMILVRSYVSKDLAPRITDTEYTWRDRFLLLRHVLPVLAIVLVVLGTMFAGVATATEAGAIGALMAVIFSLVLKGEERWRNIGRALLDSVSAVAAILFLIVGIAVLNRMISLSGIAQALADGVAGLGLGRIGLLLVLAVAFLALGTVMDPMAMILLTIPVLAPTLAAMDINMIWFGIFMVILAELAVVTPPVGINAYIVHRLAQDPAVNLGHRVRLGDVFGGALWFIAISLLLALILIFFPDLALWLPSQSAQ